ncbi:class I SAM-dependent methyltransferase [Salisediminibacterium beveridgei]|uniref:class I SAM-dependent methyltransferase n=1 Tax=Salisediminibacterium beveridgei TaxID=632773 RepID=UPI0008482E96|nr:methyltransferase [Salisediminibacterium beveridgei]
MSDHYYSGKPGSESKQKMISETLKGRDFTFIVDRGVFSGHAVDFGSKLLIEHFEEPQAAGDILDIGCGWGPIGLAVAAAYPERQIGMIDVNERSVSLAKVNAGKNSITNQTIALKDATDGLSDSNYAAVLTNPPIRAGKDVVFRIYEEAVRSLQAEGELWVVIQKKQGASSTKKKLEELGLHVRTVAKQKGYFVFAGKKID